jgi:hypothetical protein
VELDRRTLFRPVVGGYVPINARALWDMDLENDRHTTILAVAELAPPETAARGSIKDERKTRNALPKVKMLGGNVVPSVSIRPTLTVHVGWPNVLKKLVERFPLTLQGEIHTSNA